MSKIADIGDKVVIKEDKADLIYESYGMETWFGELRGLIENKSHFLVDNVVEDVIYSLQLVSVDNDKIKINAKDNEIKYVIPNNPTEISYEQKGKELGALVDTKQEAYGNAIAQTYEVVKAFMTPYFNEENKTYTIPQSLLQHLLLQVRIIDKQNRIFNNPSGDLMSESPYGDLGGYGLLGANMIIDK